MYAATPYPTSPWLYPPTYDSHLVSNRRTVHLGRPFRERNHIRTRSPAILKFAVTACLSLAKWFSGFAKDLAVTNRFYASTA